MKQGLILNGTLAFIKQNAEKTYEGKVSPATQTLQVSILADDGFSVIDVKDTDFRIASDKIGKIVSLAISISEFRGNLYYKLVNILDVQK